MGLYVGNLQFFLDGSFFNLGLLGAVCCSLGTACGLLGRKFLYLVAVVNYKLGDHKCMSRSTTPHEKDQLSLVAVLQQANRNELGGGQSSHVKSVSETIPGIQGS